MDSLAGLDNFSRLALVRAKVDRAKQNLIDMERSLNEFYGYLPGVQRKIGSFKRGEGLHTYNIPFDALCAAGDVIGNLVGAFDHLAYQLILAHAPNTPEDVFRTIYFPLAHDRAGYKSRLKAIKQLIHPDAVELIKSIKPYAGGNEALGLLHKFNNVSKHRLILNVAKVVVCHPGDINSPGFIYPLDEVYFFGIYGRPQVDDYILPTGLETISEIRPGQPEALLPTLHYLITMCMASSKTFCRFSERTSAFPLRGNMQLADEDRTQSECPEPFLPEGNGRLRAVHGFYEAACVRAALDNQSEVGSRKAV